MTAEGLRNELMAVPGVASAELDASGDAPTGVRVRLAPDADADAVGVEVQRILASHGMRSRVADDARAEVVPLVPESAPAEALPREVPAPSPKQGLVALAVEERTDGLEVTATMSDGSVRTSTAAPTEAGLYEAVVATVGTLVDGRTPLVVDVARRSVDGTEIVTVVLERADGARVVGSAVVLADRGFAAGRAVWAALRS